MKKVIKIVAFSLILTSILCCLTACSFIFGNDIGNTNNTGTPSDGVGDKEIRIQIVGADIASNAFYNSSTGKFKEPSQVPTKEGFTFAGWYSDEACTKEFEFNTKAVGGMTYYIYAKWEKLTFTVTLRYNDNGKEDKELVAEYGETLAHVIRNENVVHNGYEFLHWSTSSINDNECNLNTVVAEDITLYAIWNELEYTITYNVNGGIQAGTVVNKFTVNSEDIVLYAPVKDGYDFIGWYLNEDFSGEEVEVIKKGTYNDVVLYARYVSNVATIEGIDGMSSSVDGSVAEAHTYYEAHEFDLLDYFKFGQGSKILVDGVETTIVTLEENSDMLEEKLTSCTVTIYSEKYVITSGEEGAMITVTINIYQYPQGKFEVKFLVDGDVKKTDYVFFGGKIKEPTDIEIVAPEHYEFAFWALKNTDTEYDFDTITIGTMASGGEIVLEAKFAPIEYVISYVLPDGAENSEYNVSTFTIESDYNLQNAIAPNGYTFDCWMVEGGDIVTNVNQLDLANATLYANIRLDSVIDWNYEKEDDVYVIDSSEFVDFVNFCIFYRIEQISVRVSDFTTSAQYDFDANDIYVPYTKYSVSINTSTLGSEVTCKYTFTYGLGDNPTDKTYSGTFTQTEFLSWLDNDGESVEISFIDFVTSTMNVDNSEQLLFALENGYKPVMEVGSNAEIVYSQMRAILSSIIKSDMTEKEKVIAIAEYLVTEVEYDNEVLDMFVGSGDDLNNYRSFYLEGAIVDGVSVCDGISKAFSSLCAIEGIKTMRVDGKSGTVNHAWNKVFTDVDGDGIREWSAIDCTAMNLLLSGSDIEVINRQFMFTSDAYLIADGYTFDAKWYDGSELINEATENHNEYSDVTFSYNSSEYEYYLDSAVEYQIFGDYVKSVYDSLASGTTLTIDVRVTKNASGLDDSDKPDNVFGISYSYVIYDTEVTNEKVIIIILKKS